MLPKRLPPPLAEPEIMCVDLRFATRDASAEWVSVGCFTGTGRADTMKRNAWWPFDPMAWNLLPVGTAAVIHLYVLVHLLLERLPWRRRIHSISRCPVLFSWNPILIFLFGRVPLAKLKKNKFVRPSEASSENKKVSIRSHITHVAFDAAWTYLQP